MPWMERANPETPCQPNGAHHPHRFVCGDTDCDCYETFGEPLSDLRCCVCGQDWPCDTKRSGSR